MNCRREKKSENSRGGKKIEKKKLLNHKCLINQKRKC